MKVNQWTLGLAAVGLVTLPAVMQAEEKLNPLLTAVTPTTISGYVNTSIEWNPGTGNGTVPAFSYNKGKQDGFNLDVVSLSLDKPLDEGQWSSGYHVDLLFGPDAYAYGTQSSGTPTDFAIKQAYVALRLPVGNGLDAKLGVYDAPTGYESFDAYKDPNYTRSYGWTIEPVSQTGLLLSYQLCKFATVSAGIANTFGPKINERANPPQAESYKAYSGSFTMTAPEEWGFLAGSVLSGSVINGFNSGTDAPYGVDQTSYYIGATINTPLKWLKVGACYDGFTTTDHSFEPGAPDTSWYANAFGLYTSMTVNEKLSFHLRGEYANTDTTLLGSDANIPGGSKVVEATATVQYALWKNVMSRLEFRWDHLAGGSEQTYYGGESIPGGASTPGDLKNWYTVALNVIYMF